MVERPARWPGTPSTPIARPALETRAGLPGGDRRAASAALGDALIERAPARDRACRRRGIEGERGPHRRAAPAVRRASCAREAGSMRASTRRCPSRTPLPRPDLRLRQSPSGPVAVFGASNFPLAFSVAGGDTASALAAGCPVVVKAHPAHPGTSELVGRAVQAAVAACGLPEGVFSLLFGAGNELGHARWWPTRGSRRWVSPARAAGGLALMRIAAARPEPIPVYAEMSSINPVLLLPAALAARRRRSPGASLALADAGRRPVLHQSRACSWRSTARTSTPSSWAAEALGVATAPRDHADARHLRRLPEGGGAPRRERRACARSRAACSPAGANQRPVRPVLATDADSFLADESAEGGDFRRLLAAGALPRPQRSARPARSGRRAS